MPLDTYIIPLVLIGLGLLIAMVRWPKIWIAAFLLYQPLFLTDTGMGLTPQEMAMGGFFAGSVLLWMIWSVGRPDRRLVRSWLDFLVLLYITLLIANIVFALMNDVDVVDWISDYAIASIMLYYFPIREYFTEERDLKQLLALAGIAAFFMAVVTVYHYRQRMMSGGFIYAFQLVASRSVLLAAIHLFALVFGAVGLFFAEWRTRIGIGLVIIANAIALFLSFGRTLWVSFFICITLAMLFLRWRQNVVLVTGMVASIIVAFAVVTVVSPRVADIGLSIVKSRLASSTQLSGGDLSFETRIVEGSSAIKKVREHPLGGNGMRSLFVAYHPADQEHHITSFVHIGYLGLAMRLGIPMLLLMLAILLTATVQCFRAAWMLESTGPNRLYRYLGIATLAFMPSLYVNIFMAGIFDQRYGNVMFAFIFACAAIAHEIVQRKISYDSTLITQHEV